MAERKTKFWNLRPDSLHTFVLRAWSLTGRSEPTDDIPIRTSGVLPIQWVSSAVIVAKPLYFFRCIRVTWTPLLGYPLRFSHYVLFRKDTTESEGYSDPTAYELWQSGQSIVNGTLENNQYFLKETGKFPQHTDQVKLDVGDESDDEKATDTGVLEEHQYHYWVWAVDMNGQTSYMSSMGQGYLGPDNAEFGKPETPTWPDPDRFETEVLIRNSWWCNIKVVWECVDGAEGYWIQTKEKDGWFWSLPFWVEHDPSKATDEFPHQQWVVLNNFLCDTEYQFKIQAINVPLVLYSGWSEIEEYLTDKDPYPPNEIMNVSAGRLRQGELFTPKGEYIKLTWDWPPGAIMLQQIEYFRIYRYEGTITAAEVYLVYLNLLEGHGLKPLAYSETKQFSGTHFIDDEVKELPDTDPILPESISTFFWNGDYGDHAPAELRTAYINNGGGTEVGAIGAEANVDGPNGAYDGDYFLRSVKLTGTLDFSDTSASVPLGNCYVSFRFKVAADFDFADAFGIMLFDFPGDEILSFLFDNAQLEVRRRAGGSYRSLVHSKVWSSDDFYTWHHIEARWNISENIYQVRVDGGSWENKSGEDPLEEFEGTCTDIKIGMYSRFAANMGNCGTRYDRVFVYDSFEIPDFEGGVQYYHYWVTAVDEGGLESLATMPGVTIRKPSDEEYHGTEGTGESYDLVSFSPPAAATLRSPLTSEAAGFNLVQVLFWHLYTVKMTWDEVGEATHYRVKIKIKPPGVDQAWSDWMYSAHIEEAHANADEEYPFFVYPIPLQKHTWIEWAVETSNLAGPTESATSGEIEILQDTEPPTKPRTPIGRCYGITDLFGNRYWAVVVLTWQPNTAYQGVTRYAIFEDGVEIVTVPHNDSLISHFLGHQDYLRFGAEPVNAASHDYKIVAIGADDVRSVESDTVTINYQEWWVM